MKGRYRHPRQCSGGRHAADCGGGGGTGRAAPPRRRTAAAPTPAGRKTQNVVLIVSDGLRWQEVFTGADPTLLNEKEGGSWLSEADLRKRYWREDADARRAALFPFLWGTVAKQGQILRQSAQGQRGARHQRQGVFLSRL